MVHVRWLAAAHFVFGLIYSIASLTITPDSAGMHQTFRKCVQSTYLNRAARTFRHPTPGRDIDGLLCVDPELAQSYNERSQPA